MARNRRGTTTSVGQIRRERTRRRLLEAARRCFAREGYEGTTVDDIAHEAGYSKGAYYFHFGSKEDVLLALVDGWTRGRARRLERAIAGRPPEETLARVLEALTAEGEEDARLALEFWSQGERNTKLKHGLHAAYRSWRELIVRALVRMQEAGVLALEVEPGEVAEALLAFGEGLLVRRAVGPEEPATTMGVEAMAALSAALAERERAIRPAV